MKKGACNGPRYVGACCVRLQSSAVPKTPSSCLSVLPEEEGEGPVGDKGWKEWGTVGGPASLPMYGKTFFFFLFFLYMVAEASSAPRASLSLGYIAMSRLLTLLSRPAQLMTCLPKSSRPCSAPWLSLLLMPEACAGQEPLIG